LLLPLLQLALLLWLFLLRRCSRLRCLQRPLLLQGRLLRRLAPPLHVLLLP
jgi:hypothetical protein